MVDRPRTASVPSPYVSKRLCMTIVFAIGILCIFGGFFLGNMARNEIRRTNDVVSFNLTIMAENLYKKAKRISPKAVHHNDPEKIAARLRDMFHCSQMECGTIVGYDIGQFVRSTIHFHVTKLIRTITNASMYFDTLR